ncbi:hypothetical protein HZS_7985 [Henneguya salminicola]|nr:hypothetical protein HZS_7985 [Henneguya salminicola]
MEEDKILLKTILGAVYNLRKQKQRPSKSKIINYLKNRKKLNFYNLILSAIKNAVDKGFVAIDESRKSESYRGLETSYRVRSMLPFTKLGTKKFINTDKNSQRRKIVLKKSVQDILLNSSQGYSLFELEEKLFNSPNCTHLINNPNEFRIELRNSIFELVQTGIFIQMKNKFVIDEHRRILSKNLRCISCENPGTLLDSTQPFIFCCACGDGYHFDCAIADSLDLNNVLISGWLCDKCKLCQICFNRNDQSLHRCAQCDKVFHKSCSSDTVQFIFDLNSCDTCNDRTYLSTLNKRTVKSEVCTSAQLLYIFQHIVSSTTPKRKPVDKIGIRKPKSKRGRPRREQSSEIIQPVSTAPPPDMLENLFNSKKFSDITEDDIKIFRAVQNSLAGKISLVPITHDANICTPPLIQFGKYEIKSWYSSPFPQEYATVCKLHICEFCLEYRKTAFIMYRHLTNCTARHPPDREIYRSTNLSIFEVDGQNYKEKFSPQKHNVSCIMTLPQYQRLGYGRFLIDFSYLLTREEGLTGSPEKPLSSLGKISYTAYWGCAICSYLSEHVEDTEVSIKSIMHHTGMDPHDISSTLQGLGLIRVNKDKKCTIIYKAHVIQRCLSSNSFINRILLDSTKLRWSPFLKPSVHTEQTISETPENTQ